MRKLLLDIHLYLGLFCAGYFIIFGVSSIGYNHRWKGKPETSRWEQAVTAPVGLGRNSLAAAVRDSLGVFGQVVGWTLKETDLGIDFRVTRPGRLYKIRYNEGAGHAKVEQSTENLFDLISTLHYTRTVPGSFWGSTWGIYAWLSLLALLYAIFVGIYFWWTRVPERRVGFWLLGVGSGGSLLLILYMAL